MRRKFVMAYRTFVNKGKTNKVILKQARKEKNIVYGARSIKQRIGIFSRRTEDWDIFSNTPKASALRTEKKLDKLHGMNIFYVKAAMHPGTWKVMHKGTDLRKGTKDDYGVADYSRIPRGTKFNVIKGVRFRTLKEEVKSKRKSLRSQKFAFRHKKDREDLIRMKISGALK